VQNEPSSRRARYEAIVRNKANLPGRAGWDGAWDEMRKTDPISTDQDIPPFDYFTLPIPGGTAGFFACPGGRWSR